MSIKKLQRELLRAVVKAGVVFVQLVGAYVDAHIESGLLTKKIVRGVFKLVMAILMWIATQYLIGK